MNDQSCVQPSGLVISPCIKDGPWQNEYTPVPVPGSLALIIIGVAAMKWVRRRK